MKQQNVKRNGSLNYLAGISSPTAANLTVQGLTENSERNYTPEAKPKKTSRIPSAFLAGLSSPSASNIHLQGVDTNSYLNVRF